MIRQSPGVSTTSLASVPMEQHWPVLPAPVLAFLELEQDVYFSHLSPADVRMYIRSAMEWGEQAAQKHLYDGRLTHLINRMIASGIRVRFLDHASPHIATRAQYRGKPPTIDIYRPSLKQLAHFFERSGYRVSSDDLVALHLTHEWFHHLEIHTIGRTDRILPKVPIKRWGPFTWREYVGKTREIAAHAFTQRSLGLSWFPTLVDHLLLYMEKGWSKTQIREHFQHVKQRYHKLIQSDKNDKE
ncbi:hypothetical protein [Polycladomyces subterraneus]|uniref:Uncharacterized protein n=1 Tax=Polycladomyces subterraneus TaxID=1016997 RepID=A0ABT8IIR2_9BACL|nr:hypothetical protein [Polycladomyces subterraneus]MDN4592642.1 hypothetical protein [Polycladomyces subterraneus]